jgi:integrase
MDLQEVQKKYTGKKVEEQALHWSQSHKGFGIKLNPTGQHRWVSFFMADGKRTYVTLGPLTISYKAALDAFLRGKHDRSIIELIEQQKSEKESPTIRDFAQTFIERHINVAWRNPKDPIRCLNKIVKQLGDIKIGALSKADAQRIQATANTQSEATNQLRILSIMFNKAIEWDVIKVNNNMAPINPVSRIKLYISPPRQVIIEEQDFKRLWETIELDTNYYVSSAIILFTLTALRKDEVLSLKWDKIIWDKGYISVIDTKNRREHQVSITNRIFKILRSLPVENEFIFPSPRNKNGYLQNIDKPYRRMKQRANIPHYVTIHDLRRSVSSYLQDQDGVQQHHVSAALNHKSIETTRKHYTIISQRKKAEVLNKMSEFYDKHMEERVVKIPQASTSDSSSASAMPG